MNAHDQAFPIQGWQHPNGFEGPSGGMDLRTYIAVRVSEQDIRTFVEGQGWLYENCTPQERALARVRCADSLIAELNRKEGQT